MKLIALAASLLCVATSAAAAPPGPPAPYESRGVCPFECCTYREWTATADVPVHAKRDAHSRVLFDLRPGDKLDAVTGVVVTERAAKVTVDHAMRDGVVEGDDKVHLPLHAGDVLYMLTPLGEGAYLFWYRGKVYHSGPELAALPGVGGKALRTTWWKQVRNKAGRTGWASADDFANADDCG